MTRALLPKHLSAAVVAAAACLGAACNSDDLEQYSGTATAGTTEVDPTMVPVFTTGEPIESTSTTEVPVPEKTCRGGIACATTCLINIPDNMPEWDWQGCLFDDCLELLSVEEWRRLFRLSECIVGVCSERPECMEGSEECNQCYLQMLALPPAFEGCDEQAAACK